MSRVRQHLTQLKEKNLLRRTLDEAHDAGRSGAEKRAKQREDGFHLYGPSGGNPQPVVKRSKPRKKWAQPTEVLIRGDDGAQYKCAVKADRDASSSQDGSPSSSGHRVPPCTPPPRAPTSSPAPGSLPDGMEARVAHHMANVQATLERVAPDCPLLGQCGTQGGPEPAPRDTAADGGAALGLDFPSPALSSASEELEASEGEATRGPPNGPPVPTWLQASASSPDATQVGGDGGEDRVIAEREGGGGGEAGGTFSEAAERSKPDWFTTLHRPETPTNSELPGEALARRPRTAGRPRTAAVAAVSPADAPAGLDVGALEKALAGCL